MANAFTNVVLSRHATLTAATVDSVTFASDHDQVEVVNRSGTAEIYFTTDGSTTTSGGSRDPDGHLTPMSCLTVSDDSSGVVT